VAEEAVGVFVAAALPGRVGVAEEHWDVGCEGDVGVVGHVYAVIVGNWSSHYGGEALHACVEEQGDALSTLVVGDLLQQHESGGVFDQGQNV
jgi:hypothetical protein